MTQAYAGDKSPIITGHFDVKISSVAARALWYVNPSHAEIWADTLHAQPNDDCLVRALHSAVSRGTESLVFHGQVPESEYSRMRAPAMGGHFPFPVKYGYCHVGLVEQGPAELEGQRVFSLWPHQTAFFAPAASLCRLPDALPGNRAVLAANMETALNAVWTAKVGPADRIAVVGGGVVGLLVAYLCGQLPGAQVTVIDLHRGRATLCHTLGVRYAHPEDLSDSGTDSPSAINNCDVVFHTSGHPAGLATALGLAGEEATVVELSWYGTRQVEVPLGQAFHSRQLRLLSCQVGHIEADHRPRWSYRRRLQAALDLLLDDRLDHLLAPAVDFDRVPGCLGQLLDPTHPALCQVIDYPTRS